MNEETKVLTDTEVQNTQTTAPVIEEKLPKRNLKDGEFIKAIGRRKTATAQVRVYKAAKEEITVNGQAMEDYFRMPHHQKIVRQPFTKTQYEEAFKVTVIVQGGGVSAQAEAIRHGISRAFISYDPNVRPILKQAGMLRRDPRAKERKKPGLKKARKASQWSKR